ncbi:MAG: hypothetical protein AAF567_19765 [Actinomycetota bacterium]
MVRDAFLARGPWQEDELIGVGEALAALAISLGRLAYALVFDHGEAHLLERECNEFISARIGRPDAFWADPGSYRSFEWSGAQVGEGLVAFDRWLVEDQLDHNAREGLDLDARRLVEVYTGTDMSLSVIAYDHLVDEAIARLARVGLRARRQTDFTPAWS